MTGLGHYPLLGQRPHKFLSGYIVSIYTRWSRCSQHRQEIASWTMRANSSVDGKSVFYLAYVSAIAMTCAMYSRVLHIAHQTSHAAAALWINRHAIDEGRAETKSMHLHTFCQAQDRLSDSTLPPGHLYARWQEFSTAATGNIKLSAEANVLVFSDYVHADGDLKKEKEHDEAWENRGDSGVRATL
ncbi:hypothetical protein OBBRIDRAFT_405857 [Obba rivulosa]|uniref:Uncharacterized protein n=1 Tax=Obba rivulosa TaxID=1052685 RepID=A0A8E2AYG0_9APHY|nr:hypothetical protein OBBRIDRAFT_405857 [Obba rivulosa]